MATTNRHNNEDDMSLAMTLQQFETLIDQESPYHYEFIDGVAYNMTGSTRAHADICMNTAFAIRSQLGSGPCRVYTEQYVRIPNYPSVIPDVVLTCDLSDRTDDKHKTFKIHSPLIVIEVLSESTKHYDRAEKFTRYKHCPTLSIYILIHQDQPLVELYSRSHNWSRTTFTPTNPLLHLEPLDLELSLHEIYESVLLV